MIDLPWLVLTFSAVGLSLPLSIVFDRPRG